MVALVLGLVIFLGLHSLRIFSEKGRNAMLERFGEARFKGIYSILSLIGVVMVVHGYGLARMEQSALYTPPAGLRHLALVLVPVSLILVGAAYAPAGRIKQSVHHPMVLGVAIWAFAHLLANGGTADVVLFGAFGVWAVVDYVNALGRPETSAGAVPAFRGDIVAIVIGLASSAVFIGGLHAWLFGVSPLP
ncbi:NnrU family protein [Jiella marina]|uniref:NnrU family protein n=1 Tax=Jiella sp. LLJ827 TaxID=2917712 RepID=UPI002101A6FD|nr:NnrU family protein [Jiella sp. LLJ827]